jgi:hypothetical protein
MVYAMAIDVFMPVDAFVKDLNGSERDKQAICDSIKDLEKRLRAQGLGIGQVCLSKYRVRENTPHLDIIVSDPFEVFMNYAKARGSTHIFEDQSGPPERWDYWLRLEEGAHGYTATVGAVCKEQSRRPGFTYSRQFDE